MDKKAKAKWIKALRSGKFKQTTGKLYRKEPPHSWCEPSGYCCLGVLKETVTGKNPGTRAERLDRPLRVRLGITSTQEKDLIAMNDDHKFSFRRIATWIEKNL